MHRYAIIQVMKFKRLIFGDESGDAGMNIGKGSSRYFTISFVIFDDFLEAEKASLEIKKLRRLRFKNDTQEFHFTKDSMATRKDFFEAISDFDFKIKAYVVDKMSSLNKAVKSKGYKIINLKFLDSKSDPLIQLADMMAGIVNKTLQPHNKDLEYLLNKIKSKLSVIKL